MLRRHPGVVFLGIGLLSFSVISLFSSSVVPLYDGIGFPDEPYRYIQAPAGTQLTAAPTSAQGISPITNGSNADVYQVATPETAPQAMVVIVNGHLILKDQRASSAPKSVQISVTPVKPTVQPANGTIAGNVYDVTTDIPVAQIRLDQGDIAENSQYISMRLPQANVDKRDNAPQPRIAYRASGGSTWQLLDTAQTGVDIYQATFSKFGEYTMVIPKPAPEGQAQPPARQPKQSKVPVVATVAIVTISLVAVALTIARRAVQHTKRKPHGTDTSD